MLRRPKALRPGDTVAVVSPAGVATSARRTAGLAALTELGFGAQIMDSEDAPRTYLSGSDHSRANQLERAWVCSADGVWCLRGGFGSVRTVESLDDAPIQRHIKPFIGFSDITALHLNLGQITFHGPVVTQLADLDGLSRDHLLAMIGGLTATLPLAPEVEVIQPGVADGVLVGGNLSVLTSLVGTPYLPALSGSLLFIEDVGEPPYRVDRMLTQLRLAGVLRGVRGLLIGAFTAVHERHADDFTALWREVAPAIRGPVLRGLPIGHGARNITVPVGARARMDAAADHVRLLEPVVAGT